MDKVRDELAAARVLDVEGREHRLGEAWESQTAVLLFLRHYG